MKAAKIAGGVLAAALALLLLALLAGLFQRLLIAGTQMARNLGDTVIVTDEDEGDEDGEAAPFQTDAPVATWPPGDDPSWHEDMPLSPVDKTANELAEEMTKK